VDFNDLVKLAQNYNATGGKTYAEGDFNANGNVDLKDLIILAQHYNTSLPGTPLTSSITSLSSDLAAAFALAGPKPAPIPATARQRSALKRNRAPFSHPPVRRPPGPVPAAPPASRATSLARVAPPVFDAAQRLPDFDESPVLMQQGDIVKFRPIDREEYDAIRAECDAGTYRYRIRETEFDPQAFFADPYGYDDRLVKELYS
jgi:hypothetical protein